MVLIFIYGLSGTGKTTKAIKELLKDKKDFLCIAFTHSAVNNLKNIYKENYENFNDNNFQTIHKFLRIPIDENGNYKIIRYQNFKIPKTLIIDEFSLIPFEIINYLFELGDKKETKFFFIGDIVQLPPITKIRNPINFDLINSEFKNINMTFKESLLIADHLSNSIYSLSEFKTSKKIILTKNFRSNENVINILNNMLNYKFDLIKIEEVEELIKNGYVVISSKYKFLKMVYKMVNESFYKMVNEMVENEGNFNTKIGKTKLVLGENYLLIENIDTNFVNGDIIKITGLEQNNKIVIEKDNQRLLTDAINILPLNFITCHKSQGQTINKVLLILDDLFEITMLYTAITRAKEDIKFLSFGNLPDKTEIEAFVKMRNTIYKLN